MTVHLVILQTIQVEIMVRFCVERKPLLKVACGNRQLHGGQERLSLTKSLADISFTTKIYSKFIFFVIGFKESWNTDGYISNNC